MQSTQPVPVAFKIFAAITAAIFLAGKISLVAIKFVIIFFPLIIVCLGFAAAITIVGIVEAFMAYKPLLFSNVLGAQCNDVLTALMQWTGIDDFNKSDTSNQ